jgi:N-acyl-D-aspartate/D-glutamate deacylase
VKIPAPTSITPQENWADKGANNVRRGYFTHIRDEASRVLEGVEEAIDVARACGIHVEIVHLKCSGVDNWGKAARVLDMINVARAQGCDIDCDAIPIRQGPTH